LVGTIPTTRKISCVLLLLPTRMILLVLLE
jgi:hypothetical protein